MHFDFATAARIIFEPKSAHTIPALARELGSRPCLVTGSRPENAQWLVDALSADMDSPLIISISGEPDTGTIAKASETARAHGCDLVIAMGGGSVMDAGKAIAALITNTADLFDYLEVVGKGFPLGETPVPLITVPTTAGTGSEVTANAVVLSREHNVKVSLRSRAMIADIAVVDPELMVSMPPSVTAATGMDALTQLIEAYVSVGANPMTDGLCREGMRRAARSLRQACEHGNDIKARTDMALASLFSGIALANAKLGAVHGFAAPLGGQFHVPHGVACAVLLPHVMEANIRALSDGERDTITLRKFEEIARILTGNENAAPEDGIKWLKSLCSDLDMPSLPKLGVTPQDFGELADKAANASSMKGNPVQLGREDLIEILRQAS
ncbi:iron-containing alcohol dehydrogenase [uncultured Pseudodesulfovibrio sp.]|uniref:iron-containing alcohol dehydrogenase n=1 Tax=uncultured Pseudodesulfovibrio sp. TaxID=2035858 RepID=UPI0029C6BFF0|nr:iron-containing alcohol dehydrogenase [uncultured Pseudodesulfovibrio sp.]